MIEFDERPAQIGTNIKIVGVGGAGGNAVNTMIEKELYGVEFIAANTDISDLVKSQAKMKLQLGKSSPAAWAPGQIPMWATAARKNPRKRLSATWKRGYGVHHRRHGGGTGTGAAPVIAKIARIWASSPWA